METYEFEGKTAEEAIEKASRELNIPVEELDVHIIEPGSAGIFGLVGTRKTRVRVNVVREEEEEVEETGAMEEVEADKDYSFDDEESEGEEAAVETAVESYSDNYLEKSKEVLEKLLALIPVEAKVAVGQAKGKINLNIEGDTSGVLIGRKGKTLDAIEYIVNRIINNTSDKKIKVIIDSENYRQRHIDSLNELALKLGEKVKKQKKSLSTPPLNPHDRRIVHLALKNDNQLDTKSRGEGLLKKVVVILKK
jgi:spoIIIJ-associated protein